MRLLLIGAGGFVGAILRHAIGGWVQRLPFGESFPTGTIAVNFAGCFALGGIAELAEVRSHRSGAGERKSVGR